ncbi:glycerol-3-phosphate responsive antiterminator, partial [Staphylococcus epidermidis]|uniref:glycerol-3-phosphate responsive antiterminator n=1 Tax=Staphylococcus epidermidis TaxID=1282 RepID=UPI0016426926
MKNNIFPPITNIRHLQNLIKTHYKPCLLLHIHIRHFKTIIHLLKTHSIQCYLHIHLIKPLTHHEFPSHYIIQQYKPKAILST